MPNNEPLHKTEFLEMLSLWISEMIEIQQHATEHGFSRMNILRLKRIAREINTYIEMKETNDASKKDQR